MNILLTCDDGRKSPLLVPFLDAIAQASWCSEVRPVVPQTEQSWISQAVTRFRPLQTEHAELGSHAGFAVDGTPADCASLGINNLYASRPDYLFSGINLGINAGLAFLLSSGTVGAAMEGMLHGIRAVAFSAELPPEIFDDWHERRWTSLDQRLADWQRLSTAAVSVAKQLIDSNAWNQAALYSVNLPWMATSDSEIEYCSTAETYFNGLFEPCGEGKFQHRLRQLATRDESIDPEQLQNRFPLGVTRRDSLPWPAAALGDPSPRSDLEVLLDGKIAITPIRF